MPVEVPVVLRPVELGDAEGVWRGPVESFKVTAAVEPEPYLVLPGIARPIPNFVDGGGLGRGQAVLRRSVRRSADVGRGVEGAGAGIVDDAIAHSIRGIARLDGRSANLGELGRSNGAADQILHGDLAPHLRRP